MVTLAELPDWLRRLYPFEPGSFPCGSARMSYVDEGPRSDEGVLLVHGNPTWSFFFRELIGRLASAGMRCVAPDHIGMGLSDKPGDYPYRLAVHIANIEGLVAALGLRRVHLVVHDWGGAIGFGLAVRHPGSVGRIVILNTAAFPSPRIPLRISLCRMPLVGARAHPRAQRLRRCGDADGRETQAPGGGGAARISFSVRLLAPPRRRGGIRRRYSHARGQRDRHHPHPGGDAAARGTLII